ncbi:MAG: RNHCP domain-containing protein [Candidatus Shapirobacteria bacterium]
MRKTTRFAHKKGFTCHQCQRWVAINKLMGTRYRNHCPFCLFSQHIKLPCHGLMKPLALTFKKEGEDKYGQPRQGELMLVHQCQKCFLTSINRLAADDDPQEVLRLFDRSLKSEEISFLKEEGVLPLKEEDRGQVMTQLFGKTT